jgi:hypothetical protein
VVELKGGIKLARGGWEDYPGIRGRTDGRPREEPQHQPILLQHHLPHQTNPTHTENTVREIPAKYATQKQFYIHF